MSHLNAQIVRFYDTVFDRAPDAEGLEFWNDAAHRGLTLDAMAGQFMIAPEFAATYGQPTNLAFVQEMYANVLDRPGEAEGVAFWTQVLDLGLAGRSHIVVSFSESQEHIAQMAAPVPPPVPTPPEAAPASPPPVGPTWPTDISQHTGPSHMTGSDASETIDGYADRTNTIRGNGGNDTITGGAQNDTLEGGPGNDVLIGGLGDDTFRYQRGEGHDRIADFQPGDHLLFPGMTPGEAILGPIYGPPPPGGIGHTIAGYQVILRHEDGGNGYSPSYGSIVLDGITGADWGWVQDAFIFA